LAFFGYGQATYSFKQAQRLLRKKNPEFSELSYGLAADAAILDMR